MSIKSLFVSALISAAAVAAPTADLAQTTSPPPSLTPGFDAPAAGAPLPIPSTNQPWYMAVEVAAASPAGAKLSDSLTNRRAHKFWQILARASGADNGDDAYSFVIQPSINGVSLPPMTAIKIEHKKTGGLFASAAGLEEIDVSTDAGVYSPWVPIDSGSKLSLQVVHLGASSSNFQLFEQVASFSSTIATSGGWAVSPPVQLALNKAASGVDTAYNTAKNFKVDTTLAKDQFPLAGGPSSYTYTMRDVDGVAIANITVSFAFRRTLRYPPELLSVTGYPNMAGQLLDAPSFQSLDTNGNPQHVVAQLAANASLQSSLFSAGTDVNSIKGFNAACSTLLSTLDGNGLNATDGTFFAVEYLKNTVNARYDLAHGFWTDCMTNRLPLARGIGIDSDIVVPAAPLPPPPTVTTFSLNPTNSALFGAYIIRQGKDRPGVSTDPSDDTKVLGMLAPAILWQGNPNALTAAQAQAQIGGLTATNYHCTFRIPVDDPSSEAAGVTIFLRNNGQPEKVLALMGPLAAADEDAPAATIAYRDPTAAELKACTNYENQRGGTPPPPPK